MSTVSTYASLKNYNGALLDQYPYGTCFQNTISSIISNTMRLAGQEDIPIARMAAYNMHRISINRFDQDSGTSTKVALDQGVSMGYMHEVDFAYTTDNFTVRPTTEQYAEAVQHRLVSYNTISMQQSYTSLVADIKEQISMGKVVMMTLEVKPWFDAEMGVSLANQVGHGSGVSRGGHVVYLDSYNDFMNIVPPNEYYYRGGFEFPNSWGAGFGENGRGSVDYGQFIPGGGITGLYTINGYNGIDTTWSAPRKSIALEYATIFGRPAAIADMDFWAGHYALNYTDAQIADILIASAEGAALYGSDTNAEFVGDQYRNMLGREVDASGEAYWVGRLDTGESRGSVWDSMADMVAASTTDIAARDNLLNKQNFSAFVSIARQYNGTVYNDEVADALASVTSDADALEIIKIGLPMDLNA